MLNNYSNYLSIVNDDANQWLELEKSTWSGGGVPVVDTNTQRVSTIFKKTLQEGESLPALEHTEINSWAWSHLNKSRKDVSKLMQTLIGSNDAKQLEEALNAISRLGAKIYAAREAFTKMKQGASADVSREMEALHETLDEDSEGIKDAKRTLGERIQKLTYPPRKTSFFKSLFQSASPYLQGGIENYPPTAGQPYEINSRDATPDTKTWATFIFTRAEEELKGKSPLPKQFVKDAVRSKYIINGVQIQDKKEELPQAIYNKLLEQVNGNQLIAFRLASMLTQDLTFNLATTATEIKNKLPPGESENYHIQGGQSYLDLVVDKEKQQVVFRYKATYNLIDSELSNLNPGTLLLMREITIPISEISKTALDPNNPFPSLTCKEVWSSFIKTNEYADVAILNFKAPVG